MNDPLGPINSLIEFRPVTARLHQSRWVQQKYPRPLALELHQVVIVAIAEARGPFSIRGQRTAPPGEHPTGPAVSGHIIDDRRHTLGGL